MDKQIEGHSVFISYSHTSTEHINFVIGVAESLLLDGVNVIIDQWNLAIGNDVYAFMERMATEKSIAHVLIVSDYLYTEKANRREGGVGQEVQIICQDLYLQSEQTKFIPIVTSYDENGNAHLPVFLRNRLYIDFSSKSKVVQNYSKLLKAIVGTIVSANSNTQVSVTGAESEIPMRTDLNINAICQIGKKYPVLTSLMTEAKKGGYITYATAESVLSSNIAPRIIEKWWLYLVREFQGTTRYSLASLAAELLIDQLSIGHEALEYCFCDGNLNDDSRKLVSNKFLDFKEVSAILWAHQLIIDKVKSDRIYCAFLRRHLNAIADNAYEKMASYLLTQDRGPANDNAKSMIEICSHLNIEQSKPFVERLRAWILAGQFDNGPNNNSESGLTLYTLLNSGIENKSQCVENLIDTALNRTYTLLESYEKDNIHLGLYHLYCMVEARFRGVHKAFPTLDNDIYIHSMSSCENELEMFYILKVFLSYLVRKYGPNDSDVLESSNDWTDFNRQFATMKLRERIDSILKQDLKSDE